MPSRSNAAGPRLDLGGQDSVEREPDDIDRALQAGFENLMWYVFEQELRASAEKAVVDALRRVEEKVRAIYPEEDAVRFAVLDAIAQLKRGDS